MEDNSIELTRKIDQRESREGLPCISTNEQVNISII